MTLEGMRIVIAWTAVGCGAASFAMFLLFSARRLTKSLAAPLESVSAQAKALTVSATPEQVAAMLKELAALASSLAKAGPALWTLIGSILFLLIACLAAGALASDDTGPPAKPASATARPSATTPATTPKPTP